MAQKLDQFPANGQAREGYSRYPWGDWLDGDAWELSGPAMIKESDDSDEQFHKVGDEDFVVTTKSFRSAAAQAARIRNGGIRTAIVKRDVTLTLNGPDGKPREVKGKRENVIVQFMPNAQDHEGAEDMTEGNDDA